MMAASDKSEAGIAAEGGANATTPADWSPSASTMDAPAESPSSSTTAEEDELLRSLDQIVQNANQGGDLAALTPEVNSEVHAEALIESPPAETSTDAVQPEEAQVETSGSPEDWTALSAIGALDGDGIAHLERWLQTAKPEEKEVYARRLRLGHILLYALEQKPTPPGLRDNLAQSLGLEKTVSRKEYQASRITLTQKWAASLGWPQARLLKVFAWLCLALAAMGWFMAWRQQQQVHVLIEAASHSERSRQVAEEGRGLIEKRLSFLASSDLRLTRLQALPGQRSAMAHLTWSPFGRKALLWVRDLPKPPEGREYVLWTQSGTRQYAAARFIPRGSSEGDFIDVPTLQIGRPRPIQAFSLIMQPVGSLSPEDGERILSGSTYN